jgi:indolepyruvate ferredoxin oxidoreductase beta subunit
MEPLESLRYAAWLAPDGALVTAAEPFVNIGDYPPIGDILAAISRFPKNRVVKAAELAKEAGLPRAVNMVMVGAAASFLPVPAETLEATIAEMFASKDAAVSGANKKAFHLGKDAAT